MFYVGNTLWLEGMESPVDIPEIEFFTGIIRTVNSIQRRDNGVLHSCQDLETQEWLPALVSINKRIYWCYQGDFHSFQSPTTGLWMPAIIWDDGTEFWYDHGEEIPNPNVEGK